MKRAIYTHSILTHSNNYVIEPLQANGSHVYRTKIFDYATDRAALSKDEKTDDNAIVIIDGAFLFRDDLVDYWSLKVLLEVDNEIIIDRGAKRDTKRIGSYEKAREQYVNRYVASQEIYYRQAHSFERADVVINNDDYLAPRVVKFTSSYM